MKYVLLVLSKTLEYSIVRRYFFYLVGNPMNVWYSGDFFWSVTFFLIWSLPFCVSISCKCSH